MKPLGHERTCEQETIATVQIEERLPAGRTTRLDGLSFVKNHILPLDPLKVFLIRNDDLVAGHQDVKRRVLVVTLILLVPKFAEGGAIFDAAPIRQSLQRRYEPSDLLLPVVQSRGRRDHEEGPPDVMFFCQISEERDTLYSL